MAAHNTQLRHPRTRPLGQCLQYLSVGLAASWSSGYGDLEALSPGFDADYLDPVCRSLDIDVYDAPAIRFSKPIRGHLEAPMESLALKSFLDSP